MTVWKSSVKVTSIIMWENVVLPVLLLYKHQMSIRNKIQGSNVVFKVLDRFFPLFIHECRYHVCVENNRWIKNKDRPKEVKELGNRIVSVFAHLADKMNSKPSVSDAITLLSSIIVIYTKRKSTCHPLIYHILQSITTMKLSCCVLL